MRLRASFCVVSLVAVPFAVAADAGGPPGPAVDQTNPPAAVAEMRHGGAPGPAIHAHVCGLHF